MSYGLLAEFGTPDALLSAARHATDAGYRHLEAYTPFPVPGLAELTGPPRGNLSRITLIGGLFGAATGYLMQYYSAVIAYPFNIGGRPLHSWPAFISVTVETAILFAAIAAFLGMLAYNRMPRLYHPLQASARFELATRDRFLLCIRADDHRFHDARRFLAALHPLSVEEVTDQ